MKTYFVDSFTNEKFKGNPAAVCLVEIELSDQTMQSIAREIGLSETAFITRISDQAYKIRFYTPKIEIPLCGHATLAASKIIFDTTSTEQLRFVNRNGVALEIQKADDKIVMQFPVYNTEDYTAPITMLEALGVAEVLDCRYSPTNKIILIQITGTEALAKLSPDFFSLINSHSGINGVLVTSQSENPEFDFHYRYFWPWAGTNEDPVTGGVQTFLTKYWAQKLNKNKLSAFQSSPRTGKMETELLDGKVLIYGEAVTVLEGEFKI